MNEPGEIINNQLENQSNEPINKVEKSILIKQILNSENTRNVFIKWKEIIKMGNKINNSSEKLSESLFKYIPPNKRLNFILMYFDNYSFLKNILL